MRKKEEKHITGLIGYPLGHTLSPAMHNAVFKRLKLNWEYRVFETKPKDVGKAIKRVRKEKMKGINVTVPHKHMVMKYLDRIDRAAKAVGAVNTVVNKNGKLAGYNTDYLGFLTVLKKNRIKIKNKRIVLIGAGGAAHAVVYALNLLKPHKIDIVNIDIPMSIRLVKKLKPKRVRTWMLKKTPVIDWLIAKADFVINATSVGMDKKSNPYRIDKIRRGTPVFDLIYNPAVTPFLKRAKQKGARIYNGLDMLIYQGMESFYLWTGKRSHYPTVKKAVTKYFKKS